MENRKYPIGDFTDKGAYSAEEIASFLEVLGNFPEKLEHLVSDITEEELNTPYREGGWTAQQVIHHIADSHMNMLVRLKWTLTEETPPIKAYFEDRWATLSDYTLPIGVSVSMLKAIHAKVVALLENLNEVELNKGYFHPESKKIWPLKSVMALYAWHGEHHLAHIKISKGEWSF
ncbi:MAG: putative metal-dependent hydrolase [Cytophagales bacterium]|nr:putative metal-dependent hydrolase [Cytophagales bacterium]